eukprot:COSAG05_NODE_35_length_27765_cov_221.324719_1_plen_330_part_00
MQLPDLLARAETDRGGAAGERLVGYKVGCTSAKVQQAFGIPGPIYGRLWEGEQFHSPPEVSPMCLSLSSFNGLAIEGELMVQLVDTSGDSPAQWSAQAPCVFVCLCLSFSVSLFRDWLLVRAHGRACAVGFWLPGSEPSGSSTTFPSSSCTTATSTATLQCAQASSSQRTAFTLGWCARAANRTGVRVAGTHSLLPFLPTSRHLHSLFTLLILPSASRDWLTFEASFPSTTCARLTRTPMLPSDVAPPIVAFSHHRDHELRLDQVPLDVPIKVTISDGETRVGDGAWSVGWEESAELGALLIDGRPGALYCMPVVSSGILKYPPPIRPY